MKVLLISPPVQDFFFTPARAYPLGILYLATVLNLEGFEVRVLNTLEGNKKLTLETPKDFSYLKKYYHQNKSPFCLFSHYYHFGLAFCQIEQDIRTYQPAVVGISSNFSAYFESALEVAHIVKKIDKRIKVVFGGRFATSAPELLLAHKHIDFVLRGEAEYSFLKLCRSIAEGKIKDSPGLCYVSRNKLSISSHSPVVSDLNRIPIPDRSLIAYGQYKYKGDVSTSLITSRGCSLGCRFCAIHEKFRWRIAEGVFNEIKECVSLGIRHFNFEDDNINLNPQFEKLLDMIIANLNGQIAISFMNGLLSRGLTTMLQEKLVNAGLTHADFSLVSSLKALRRASGRKEDVRRIFAVSGAFAKCRIRSTVHFITGLPRQTFRDALGDVRMLAGQPVLLGPSIFYPVIESPMFKELKEKYALREENHKFFRSSSAYFDKSISRNRLFFIFYLSRIVNFIKEITDIFDLDSHSFYSFLKRTAQKYQPCGRTIASKGQLDRVTLGVILLDKVFNENKVFLVEERKINGEYSYEFIEEGFILPGELKKAFRNLKIRSVAGKSLITGRVA